MVFVTHTVVFRSDTVLFGTNIVVFGTNIVVFGRASKSRGRENTCLRSFLRMCAKFLVLNVKQETQSLFYDVGNLTNSLK